MSFQALSWAKKARTGSPTRKAVLLVLAEYADEDGYCYPSQARIHEELNARGVELRSVTEAAIDTGSPMGRMVFSIFAGMAEGERETITLRTKAGRVEKGRAGGIACGPCPYGYRRGEDGAFVVDEVEAVIVRLIYDLREDGLLLRQIADRLNAAGHVTRILVLDERGDIAMAGVAALGIEKDGTPTCHIKACAGRNMRSWLGTLADLEAWAAYHGARQVRFAGRAGWRRVIAGYRFSDGLFVKDL